MSPEFSTDTKKKVDEIISRYPQKEAAILPVLHLTQQEFGRISPEEEKLVAELQIALSEVKVLGGLLPICSSCKKIRDDEGYWNQIESYIQQHSDAEFSHGICPDCASELYPRYGKKRLGRS